MAIALYSCFINPMIMIIIIIIIINIIRNIIRECFLRLVDKKTVKKLQQNMGKSYQFIE